ncbi:MAG: hypothetical protein ACTSX2_00060 [Candidatus Thorarchaeota archaeon]
MALELIPLSVYKIPPHDKMFSGETSELMAGTSITWGKVCMLQGDGKYDPAIASSEATSNGRLAFAMDTLSDGDIGEFLIRGYIKDENWSWTVGGIIYLSASSPGELTQTKPSSTGDIVRILGYAISQTVIWFDPDSSYVEVP